MMYFLFGCDVFLSAGLFSFFIIGLLAGGHAWRQVIPGTGGRKPCAKCLSSFTTRPIDVKRALA